MPPRSPPDSNRAVLYPESKMSSSDKIEQGAVRSPTSEIIDIDSAAERRLLWKLDLNIYPILYVVYMMSFLDRINISNARIQNMTAELDLTTNRFNIALFIYFVPYILLEVPSNILIRRVRPSWYLGGLMFCWGVVNMCMGFVRTYEQLVALRVLLGVFEAGVLPGIIYLTSMYYRRHEFQKRMSTLFSSTLVGGAFGGLLAYGIGNLQGRAGYSAWRWIFIIEGAITAVVALVAVFLIVDWPEQARFLSAEEKDLLRRRLDTDGADACRMDTLDGYAYRRILTDYKIWLSSLVYMGIGTTGYATTFFMPTVLLEFGWSAQWAQWHTVPVYVVSAAGMLLAAWLSDRLRHRYGFILFGSLVATAGYVVLLNQGGLSRDVKYTAVFLICLGGYVATPIALAWLQNNLSGQWKRAFGASIQVTLGNIAGILGANIFVQTESPRYPTGYGTAFGMLWMGTIAATVQFLLLWRENRKRERGERDGRLGAPRKQVQNMGDYHPDFRFTL